MSTERTIWRDGEFVPWADATVHVLAQSLQRGSLAFDYISVHQARRGVAAFRLRDHVERLARTCRIVGLPLDYAGDDLVDACAARMVRDPETLDVLVASNLFGDILSDIGGALMGSLGVPPSANLSPGTDYPPMFEPVHGSAPDIAGQEKANPLAAIWSAAMMVEEFGNLEAANLLLDALADVTRSGVLTVDLGGTASTGEFGEAVRTALRARAS